MASILLNAIVNAHISSFSFGWRGSSETGQEGRARRLMSHVEQGRGWKPGNASMAGGADDTAGVRLRYAALLPPSTPAGGPEGPYGTRGLGNETIFNI